MNDQFDELVTAAPGKNGHVTNSGRSAPYVCNRDRTFSRAVRISYPPRDQQRQVGAEVTLYFDAEDKVATAEFIVIPLAP